MEVEPVVYKSTLNVRLPAAMREELRRLAYEHRVSQNYILSLCVVQGLPLVEKMLNQAQPKMDFDRSPEQLAPVPVRRTLNRNRHGK